MKRDRNIVHQRTVQKYGAENIVIKIIDCDDEKSALALECQLIRELRSQGHVLTNLTDGGEGTSGFKYDPDSRCGENNPFFGKKHSAETKAMLSARMTPERREALRQRFIGVSLTEAAKKKMSIAAKRRGISKTAREKMAESLRGKKHSAETKAKMSAASKGRKKSNEARAKMSAARKGKPLSPFQYQQVVAAIKRRFEKCA